MKVIFATYASDDYFTTIGAPQLICSAKYFHPDIPIVCFSSKTIDKKLSLGYTWITIKASLLEELTDYDLIVYFDADSILVDKIDEIFNLDFDIAGCRNNNDFGKAGCDEPYTLEDITADKYLNAGFICIKNKDFIKDFDKLSKEVGDQIALNLIFYRGKYKSLLLDPPEAKVHYGISAQNGVKDHFESYKDIKVREDGLYLYDKKIKIIHEAGGHRPNKLDINRLFNQDVVDYLNYIFGVKNIRLINDEWLSFDIKNKEILEFMFDEKNYVQEILDQIRHEKIYDQFISKEDKVFLDIGAYLGTFAIHVSPYAEKITCVEPHPRYFRMMKELTGLMIKNCDINYVQAALSVNDNQYNFYSCVGNTTMASLLGRDGEMFVVRGCNLLDLGPADFCKIDIEGSEVYALTPEILAQAKIKKYHIEFHDAEGRSFSEWREYYAKIFVDLGYKTQYHKHDALYCEE